MIEYKQNNYRLTTSVSIFARFPIMKLQMKSQITSIVNRVIAEMTVVLGSLTCSRDRHYAVQTIYYGLS